MELHYLNEGFDVLLICLKHGRACVFSPALHYQCEEMSYVSRWNKCAPREAGEPDKRWQHQGAILSWVSWLLWIPYICAPALDTHTPSEPDLFQSLLHCHNITHTRPILSHLPSNIMTFAYRCLTCADNACDVCVCVCLCFCVRDCNQLTSECRLGLEGRAACATLWKNKPSLQSLSPPLSQVRQLLWPGKK